MISIIVPHYSTKREYFDKCMHSLLNDQEADIEVLIIDDGSPAEYQSQINAYSSDNRVRAIYEPHKGVSHVRNTGIREANGEWIMFVDSDDYLEPGYYSVLEKLVQNANADIIFFNGYGDKNGNQLKNNFFVKENVDYGESLEKKCQIMGAGLSLGRTPEYRRCFYTLGSPCSKLISAEFIKKNKISFDENIKFAEDTLFSLNMLLQANHIIYIDEYLYHYFMNEQSVTGKFRSGLSKDVDAFFDAVESFIDEHNLRDQLFEAFYIRAFLEAQRCVRQEFYHKDNPDSSKIRYREAMRFVEKEPYYLGIKADYPYMKSKSCIIAAHLLQGGRFGLYMKMYEALAAAKRMFKKG